jgi:cellulose synthase/poly-beta-1,6-N-acetylglucosamine synthase-like glycosyltransferase
MHTASLFFWISLSVAGYTYLGYGLLLFLMSRTKAFRFGGHGLSNDVREPPLPRLTLVIAAYNEADVISDKIANSLALDYPAHSWQILVVTDGSTDGTDLLVEQLAVASGTDAPPIRLFHQPERRGKMAAVDRILPFVDTAVTVFTDANTHLNQQALRRLASHFQHPAVGVVAGEKRIRMQPDDAASTRGEGIYWRYESRLKAWESAILSCNGAVGELFAIRTHLYRRLPADTLTEDFVLSMTIAMEGYRIIYEPSAYAVENGSPDMGEEYKRKVRIAAGGLQSLWRLRGLLNPFRHGMLTFQFISHRLFRWVLAPLALPVLFLSNLWLLDKPAGWPPLLFFCQVLFYLLAGVGFIRRNHKTENKIIFIAYYFCFLNFVMYAGAWRLARGRQSVVWEKARRSSSL